MKVVDIENWNRKNAYENFIGYSNPIFSLSTRLDVTNLFNKSKKENKSFFTNFLYLAIKCLNSIEEFRLRIYNNEVVLYDVIHPSYIVLTDNNSIVSCKTQMCDTYEEFYKNSRIDIENARHGIISNDSFNRKSHNNLYYISCMPWVDITSFSNPYNLNDKEGSSIPRLTWSKVVDENGRKKMMMDIAAHHALIDGEPVCRAFNKIQEALNQV